MKGNVIDILNNIRTELKSEWDTFPVSCCFESSLLVQKVFQELGYNVETYEGVYRNDENLKGCEHYWNCINGIMYDITSDQFGETWGAVINTNKYKGREYSIEETINEIMEDDDEYEYNEIYEELIEVKKIVNKLYKRCLSY